MSDHECPGCHDGLHPKVLSVEEWQEEYLNLVIYTVSVLKENAKLRELVSHLYEMAYPEYPSAFDAVFADRMHELEVDE